MRIQIPIPIPAPVKQKVRYVGERTISRIADLILEREIDWLEVAIMGVLWYTGAYILLWNSQGYTPAAFQEMYRLPFVGPERLGNILMFMAAMETATILLFMPRLRRPLLMVTATFFAIAAYLLWVSNPHAYLIGIDAEYCVLAAVAYWRLGPKARLLRDARRARIAARKQTASEGAATSTTDDPRKGPVNDPAQS